MKIIMLSGWKYSGKDTVGEILLKHGYTRYSFADRLKKMVMDTYGLSADDVYNPDRKELPITRYPVLSNDLSWRFIHTINRNSPITYENGGRLYSNGPLYWTPRSLLIMEGTIKRDIDPNFWANIDITDEYSVITDWRFKNELSLIKSKYPNHKVTTWRIDRFDTTDSIDPSERELDNEVFDIVISNRGTIDDLQHIINNYILLDRS